MAKQHKPKHGITPPKGKPTRPRRSYGGRAKALGSTTQWVIVTLLFLVALVVIFILSGGAGFNGNNNNVPGAVGTVHPA